MFENGNITHLKELKKSSKVMIDHLYLKGTKSKMCEESDLFTHSLVALKKCMDNFITKVNEKFELIDARLVRNLQNAHQVQKNFLKLMGDHFLKR